MEFSEKEQQLLDFIKEKEEVSLKDIETGLSSKHIGALGKLLRYDKVEISSNYNKRDENNKVIKFYKIKEDKE